MYIFSLLLLVSCSTKFGKFFTSDSSSSKRNKELMKDFQVDEEVFQKFAEKEEPAITNSESVKKTESAPAKVLETPKTTKLKKIEVESVAKRKDIKPKLENLVVDSALKTEKPKDIDKYPADYPEELRKYDKNSKYIWNKFTPIFRPGEKTILDINYMGISTGKIFLETKGMVKIGKDETYHVNVRLKTSTYYSYLYELDDNIDSYIASATNVPVKFSLIQRESGQDVDELQLFDHDEFQVYRFYKRETKEKSKKKQDKGFIPKYFQDPMSVVHFVRGLPLRFGARYDIPVVNKGEVKQMHFRVADKVTIDTKLGEKEAWKVDVKNEVAGKRLKSDELTFYYSADEDKIFLKFEAKIGIGSITGAIESYEI